MAITRKPARCDCGATLRTYARIGKGLTATEEAAACHKCGRVYNRPTCFGRTTLELHRDAKIVAKIRKSIGVSVAAEKSPALIDNK